MSVSEGDLQPWDGCCVGGSGVPDSEKTVGKHGTVPAPDRDISSLKLVQVEEVYVSANLTAEL